MEAIQIELRAQPLDPWQELTGWGGDAAASAVFVGRVRGTAMDGRPLQALEIEHYPGLCERRLMEIALDLQREHAVGSVLCCIGWVGCSRATRSCWWRSRQTAGELPSAALQLCWRR